MSPNSHMNERIKSMSKLSINQLITNVNNGFAEFWNKYNSKNNTPISATKKRRAESIARWKEKRKNPISSTTIRYPSRKRGANARARVKGKFVKVRSSPPREKNV